MHGIIWPNSGLLIEVLCHLSSSKSQIGFNLLHLDLKTGHNAPYT